MKAEMERMRRGDQRRQKGKSMQAEGTAPVWALR